MNREVHIYYCNKELRFSLLWISATDIISKERIVFELDGGLLDKQESQQKICFMFYVVAKFK